MLRMFFPASQDKKQIWSGLYGSSLSLALAEFCQQSSGIKLIVAPDHLAAQQLHDELQFFLNKQPIQPNILFFPDWETLPYDQFSPHQDIISDRLACLSRLQSSSHAIVLTAVSTIMHRICPATFLQQTVLVIKKGQTLDLGLFKQQLIEAGYHLVDKVLEHGEFAIRGALIDLFPMGHKRPFRLELFDNEVDNIRLFDQENQRTIEKISAITILPAREFPLNDDSISQFRRAFRQAFSGNPSQCPMYESVSAQQCPHGIEYYLPLFFESTATIFDYLTSTTQIFLVGGAQAAADQFWQEIENRYAQKSHDVSRPILKPAELFIAPHELLAAVNQTQQMRLFHDDVSKKGARKIANLHLPPSLPIDRKSDQPLHLLSTYLSQPGRRHLLVVESKGRREVLSDMLKAHQITPSHIDSWQAFLQAPDNSIAITIGSLNAGLEIADVAIVVEAQLFGEYRTPTRRNQKKSIDPDLLIRDLVELQVGSPVVHLEYGVGRYMGIQSFAVHGIHNDFLILNYANNDRIYVPITALNLISRYTGADNDHAPLHRLGTDQWQKEKKKAQEKIHDVAVELLEIYAKRAAKPGHVYTCETIDYQRFASGFPFTETQDQLRAIQEIIHDLQSPQPMDRLICGDVGFGKTEVAMRAAFIAVQNGKQVCVLVPTTLLATQHYETFRDRFAEFPINIDLLSRFKSEKEAKSILQTLQNGRTDIVIGTHKLFQKDVAFHELGLLIIDEEHRFGVKQKEHIKALRSHVDILSMTATPIPRTLNMAMAGIRDISLITTPPAKRLAIKTFWQEYQDATIREAILREILRGGQVFYLHNNVTTIAKVCQSIQQLIPEASVHVAHGQMRERELERMMSDFYHHRFNVLVCTTIIETGIDIPTANTIIIDRADKFGLAQLHQLRGRVGRSHHQAYAYLLTPPEKLLSADAVKRLTAIVSLEDLGAGFTLATHDMEIRGAGELLGEEQSGNMHAIGYHLYMEMLDKAVSDLKSGKIISTDYTVAKGAEIDLQISAILPEDYIGDIHTRLVLYKRIANAEDTAALDALQVEMIDRFGLLPDPAKNLFKITALKLLATKIGVIRIQASQQQGRIEFSAQAAIHALALIQLIQTQSQRYKLDGPTQLKFSLDSTMLPQQRIAEIESLLLHLAKV